MPDNFNTIEGTEVLNLNDDIQGSHAVTVDDLKEYSNIGVPGELVFEAYIRQSGNDNIVNQTSGSLVIGTTYLINGYISGDDFTNVGAQSNTNNVRFIATGTTPSDWSNGSELTADFAAPICSYILKNTLNITGFKWIDGGRYRIFINGEFTSYKKLFVTFGVLTDNSTTSTITSTWVYRDSNELDLYSIIDGSPVSNFLNCYIKIVVLP